MRLWERVKSHLERRAVHREDKDGLGGTPPSRDRVVQAVKITQTHLSQSGSIRSSGAVIAAASAVCRSSMISAARTRISNVTLAVAGLATIPPGRDRSEVTRQSNGGIRRSRAAPTLTATTTSGSLIHATFGQRDLHFVEAAGKRRDG
jgi:hypothetical protein